MYGVLSHLNLFNCVRLFFNFIFLSFTLPKEVAQVFTELNSLVSYNNSCYVHTTPIILLH